MSRHVLPHNNGFLRDVTLRESGAELTAMMPDGDQPGHYAKLL